MHGSRVKLFATAFAWIGIAVSLPAQKPGGSPASRGGSIPGTPTGGRTAPAQPGATTRGPGLSNRGLYLSGRVLMDDGTPPPEPVTIERICGSSPRAQAYTDQKGRFSFEMGQTAGIMQDASESGSASPYPNSVGVPGGPQGRRYGSRQGVNSDFRLAGCELRAQLAGYRSDSLNLGGRRLLDNPDVGTITLHRLANVEGTVISMTSLQAPKDARKAYEKGRKALQKNKAEEAEKEFRKAVENYPKYAAAWYELGRIQQQNRDIGQARNSYGKALEADSRYLNPYVQLAEIAAAAENWRELADTTDRVLKLDPVDYPAAYLYNAAANLNLGNLNVAEKSARAAEKLDTEHRFPKIEEVLATVLAQKKDFAGAAEHLRGYLQFAPPGPDAERIKRQIAEYERASGSDEARKDTPPQ